MIETYFTKSTWDSKHADINVTEVCGNDGILIIVIIIIIIYRAQEIVFKIKLSC